MKINIVTEITDEIVEAFGRLLPQLSSSAILPDKKYLEKIIESPVLTLFVAEDQDRIVGTLSLIVYEIPTGTKAWIEDVVTDEAARGKGVARKLVEAALVHIRIQGIKKVDLTSSNDRVAAHELYRKTGFEKRDTSVFRIEL
ncbi:MAG: GNAT family N-acetyltransferase [Dysgonomonas sp.]|nr:GNAT family N-acetyltransferase [Dysgonomonas sp.]